MVSLEQNLKKTLYMVYLGLITNFDKTGVKISGYTYIKANDVGKLYFGNLM